MIKDKKRKETMMLRVYREDWKKLKSLAVKKETSIAKLISILLK